MKIRRKKYSELLLAAIFVQVNKRDLNIRDYLFFMWTWKLHAIMSNIWLPSHVVWSWDQIFWLKMGLFPHYTLLSQLHTD